MKKIIIIPLIMLLVSVSNAFSQKMISELERKKIEERAIQKMRKTFHISKETELFATTIYEVIDTTKMFEKYIKFDIKNKIENYLHSSKIVHYEIFVYDNELKNVYVVNRIFLGCGKFKKEYFLGRRDDLIFANFFRTNQHDYVLNIGIIPLVKSFVFLCFKNAKIDLAYLENENIRSVSVCYNDAFDFLDQ